MKTENKFYEKLKGATKEGYDEIERMTPHTDKFRYLMDHPTNENYPHFNDEDLEYLCKEDLTTVNAIYPDDAAKYMDW